MSSFAKASKCGQKTHRERSQLSSRVHLGFLEKKKDYQERAKKHNKKHEILLGLKRKALDRNPDEFYYKMVRSGLKDGIHNETEKAPEYTPVQLKLIQSQDANYIKYKRSLELKRIEKLKSELHLLDLPDKPQNQHLVFVDSKKEEVSFDPAAYFQTHPSLVNRSYNRIPLEKLKTDNFKGFVNPEILQKLDMTKQSQYKELCRRIEREKQLKIIIDKMEMKRNLIDKKAKKKLVKSETVDHAAVYKWVPQRKR